MTHETIGREVETTLPLDVRAARSKVNWRSDWKLLPTHTEENNTKWEVQFIRGGNDVWVGLRCQSLEQLYSAATVRLLVTVVDDCDNWTESTAVVLSGDTCNYSNRFSKALSEFGESAEVHVRVRWTRVELSRHVELSPRAVSHLTNGTARVQCRWQLCGLNTVRPTADWWVLWSEPFGSGAVWRMCVINIRNGSSRRLLVGVELQHICEEVEQQQQLQWCCTLTVSNKQFKEKKDMKKRSFCGSWTVVNDVDKQSTDTLDIQLLINITRQQ